jgi:amidase
MTQQEVETLEPTQKFPAISGLNRRGFLTAGMLAGSVAVAAPLASSPAGAARRAEAWTPATLPGPAVEPFELDEITLGALEEGLKSGKFTAHSLTEKYLERIEEIDKRGPGVNAVLEVNPDALAIADALDRERQTRGPRGPLHGIPVLIKDNLATRDRMQTTAGSLALAGATPPQDSFVARKLRAAGAVILGKTNLSEWANIRSSHSSSGWSGRGGQTRNPYALDRNPCGSSSGSGAAVAANLCAVAIGTETDGSIVCPANTNGIVGIKPTVGLVSRAGIIPIAHSQDTAGPMARSVTDAALLLGAIAGVDRDDPATAASRAPEGCDYTKFLDAKGLAGARIGVVRKLFGFHDTVDKLMNGAIEEMKRQGGVIVDPADIETLDQMGDAELQVLLYELKADLNAYLAQLTPDAPVHSLQEIIEFNERHREKEMPYFGQDLFIKAQAKGSLFRKEYLDAREKCKTLMRAEGIDAVMDKFKLDALVAPTGGPACLIDLVDGDHDLGGSSTPAAVAGYPNINVPVGFVFGLPVGISFFGRAWSEPTLIKLAYSFEQATKHRRPPGFLPTVSLTG